MLVFLILAFKQLSTMIGKVTVASCIQKNIEQMHGKVWTCSIGGIEAFALAAYKMSPISAGTSMLILSYRN